MEHDGIDDAVEGGLRIAVTVAGVVAEQMARRREAELRTAAARSRAEADQVMRQHLVDRQAAAGQLREINAPGWWDRAAPADVGRVWETTQAWRGGDPAIDAAADRIAEEVQRRHGIDVRDPGMADPDGLRAALTARQDAVAELRSQERRRREQAEVAAVATADGVERATTAAGINDDGLRREDARAAEIESRAADFDAGMRQDYGEDWADRDGLPADATARIREHERDGRELGDLTNGDRVGDGVDEQFAQLAAAYDTPERRVELAQALENTPGAKDDAVQARLLADVSQGRPAADAVAAGPGRSPKARKTRGRSGLLKQQQRDR